MQKAYGKMFCDAERIEKLPIDLPVGCKIENLDYRVPEIGDFLVRKYMIPGDYFQYTTVSPADFSKYYSFESV